MYAQFENLNYYGALHLGIRLKILDSTNIEVLCTTGKKVQST